jgi:hypothetical protein
LPRLEQGQLLEPRRLLGWCFRRNDGAADHRRLDTLADAEEADRPLFRPGGKLLRKSRALSAATGIEAPPSVDVFLLVEGLA